MARYDIWCDPIFSVIFYSAYHKYTVWHNMNGLLNAAVDIIMPSTYLNNTAMRTEVVASEWVGQVIAYTGSMLM